MDFIDEIKQYCKRVDSLKDNLSTEEANGGIKPLHRYTRKLQLYSQKYDNGKILNDENIF